ncbi:MAG TPA: proline iminopeptidase-family hydrolase [Bacillota bacterium]|nr:proline iminopeptidase-family hydrolase [Bacillota bacterium]
MKITDDYLSINGHQIYYKVAGKPSKRAPLVVLHGGPGSCHNYLLSLAAQAKDRQVVFYDQLGCGLSDKPQHAPWSFELFIDELTQVRACLGLDDVHLLGHSWGGMLAIEYMLTRPSGIRSLILASTMISLPLFQAEVELLKSDLPGNLGEVLRRHEKAGTTLSPEYTMAMHHFNRRHNYRHEYYPNEYRMPPDGNGLAVYNTLWGPSEAYANGSLKKWDRIKDLHTITQPTLITSGQYDELTPQQAVITHDNMPNSQLHILSAASHLAHIERADDYNQLVHTFLRSSDR